MGFLQDWFRLSNAQQVCVVGHMPDDLRFGEILIENGHAMKLSSLNPLKELVRKGRPVTLVTFVGTGTSSGFRVREDDVLSRQLLPEGWWRLEQHDLYLFAFSCFSAEFLEGADLVHDISSSLAFEDEVWFSGGQERFWIRFIRKLMGTLSSLEKINSETYARIQNHYLKALRGRGIARGRKLSHLTMMCLLKQSQALRVVEGSRI